MTTFAIRLTGQLAATIRFLFAGLSCEPLDLEEGSTMNRSRMIRSLLGVFVATVSVFSAGGTHAEGTIGVNDSFGGTIPDTDWTFLKSTSHASDVITNNATYAHQGKFFLYMNLDATTGALDWTAASKVFRAGSNGPLTTCHVEVYIRALASELLAVQLIDPNTNKIIAEMDDVETYPTCNTCTCSNPSPSTCYTHQNVYGTNCSQSNSVKVQLVLSGGNAGVRLVYFDDVHVTP